MSSASELLPPPSPQETGRPSQPLLALDSCDQALQRLIDGDLPQDERATVIESVFSSQEATDIVGHLQERDPQTFIDVIHEVRYHSSISNGVGWMTLLLTFSTISAGVGNSQLYTEYPEETRKGVIQDLCSSHFTPRVAEDRVTRHFNRSPSAWWWVWGCVEEGTPGAGGCSQDVEETP